MNLEFIAVGGEGTVIAESPMAAIAAASGAELSVRDGWLLPTSFGDDRGQRAAIGETVGFADASNLSKLELHGDLAAAWPAGEPVLGTASAHGGGWWCPLTPERALVLGVEVEVEGARVIDVTTQQCGLRLEGPLVRELMASFCALDLRLSVAPVGSLLPGSVARTPGLVLVESEQRLLVLAGAAYAEYLWTVVADAAGRLGGRPVGADLLASAVNA